MSFDPMDNSGMFRPSHTTGTVLCCLCGERISPNPSNMCMRCIRSNANITSSLPRLSSVIYCPDCNSYLLPPNTWVKADLESKQLLTFLLGRVRSSISKAKLRLTHAEYVWTEPHSKRIKVKIKVQGEITNGAIVEQAHLIEFKVCDKLCDSCSRVSANPDQWVAKVQLRQHVQHRRTFFYLEQLILKHRVASKAIRIAETEQGIDFMFGNRSHAVKFVDFINGVVPIQHRRDKSLVSHDSKSSTYNYHYTFSVEISPICREDLICLPPSVANGLGNFGPIVICTKVTNSIALLDPLTLRMVYLDAKDYWRVPFKALLTSRQLVEYIVLDVEVDSPEFNFNGSKYCMAYAQVARVSDFGKNDNMFMIRTHLGHLLNPGDYALGYDVYAANTNDDMISQYKSLELPDVILIKKSYEQRRQRKKGKARKWKLKRLNMEVDVRIDEDKKDDEYELFLRELEENPESRFNISLYKNEEYQQSEMASTVGGDDFPDVRIDELLADLDISDQDEDKDEDDEDDNESVGMME